MPDSPAPLDDRSRRSPLDVIREQTPARILVGRAGSSYRTGTLLDLRRDHAAALDAVRIELDMVRDLGQDLVDRFGLFEVATRARSKDEYLMRPDLGRCLLDSAAKALEARCERGADLQVAIGDGLSAAAVAAQVPALLFRLAAGAESRRWTFGRPFVIRYCRVGVLNEIGDHLDPSVVVLLIGERPGLATAESLSAYMAYRPRSGHTDAQRSLVSNIHARGLSPDEAAARIFDLAALMRQRAVSGVALTEGGAAESQAIEGC
jgi:ethanolamine ammonia-lyase small subunit